MKKTKVGDEKTSHVVESDTTKAKASEKEATVNLEDNENPNDLCDDFSDDMEIIHLRKDHHGRLVKIETPIKSEYEKIRERAIAG